MKEPLKGEPPFRVKWGHCESSVFITYDVLVKLKAPADAISFTLNIYSKTILSSYAFPLMSTFL